MIAIPVASIRRDGGTQVRATLSDAAISDYTEAIRAGASLPPIIVFHDGSDHWLADGFHRVEAVARAGIEKVVADVRPGTRRDAVLYACGANTTHGLRRTNEDKRRAVELLLRDEEWSQWSDRKIAQTCGVSDRFVGNVRKDLSPNGSEMRPRKVERGGTVYEQKIANIGKAKPQNGEGARPAAEVIRSLDLDGEELDDEDVEDDPEEYDGTVAEVLPDIELPSRWGDVELAAAVVRLIHTCRGFVAEMARHFEEVDPAFRAEFARRAESTLLDVTDSVLLRLPADAARAEANRSRFQIVKGGK